MENLACKCGRQRVNNAADKPGTERGERGKNEGATDSAVVATCGHRYQTSVPAVFARHEEDGAKDMNKDAIEDH